MPAPTTALHELAAEQAYLDHARAQLARMRERTRSLEANGGDTIAGEQLARMLWLRAQSLVDDPGTALFFGRLDLLPDAGAHRWYVGRRHVGDEAGDPVVIDWRAPVSTAFYRASPAEPMGVARRRRFGFDHGTITAFEDETLSDPGAGGGHSQILADEIERPRVGPMRDIVATIQPEQDVLVRAGADETVCIQGAPGTGKTAVGLHRAAYLLYAHRDRLVRQGVLVVGPNRAFLDHIGAVLPTLGEIQVQHATVEDLLAAVPVRATDSTAAAVLKGDERMAQVLHTAVWSHVDPGEDALVAPRGARRWRVAGHEVREIVDELRSRGVRYDAARQMLPHRLAHVVLTKMEAAGDSPDDRVQDAVARSAPVRRFADTVWPRVEPTTVLHRLWSDADALRACTPDLTDDERSLLSWDTAPRTARSARWTAADAVLLDELADIITRTPSLGHVVLDEAQDLSAMQLRAVGRRCSTGSATVLGDIGQGTTPWATTSWDESLRHLGQTGTVTELRRGFRVPAAVIEYAAWLLPLMAPGLAAPESVRSTAGRLDVRPVPDAVAAVPDVVARLVASPGSVGVIVPDALVETVSGALARAGIGHGVLGRDHGDVEHQVDVVPATVAKGLEFDEVVVVEPAAVAAAEPDERTGLRRLYVVLTRAVSGLTVLHAEPLPAALA